ncbi:hypothetical protein D5366_10210 [Neokomagataea tanensis]|uniref:Uncharacterized protein n=1 Tax=Neokomagataea tanensis TaxID=661191 RepID=A0A4Y6V6C4_9PROT|nr:hypothetical protein D5366_10210 [Neokomagataea tanensis]
MASFYPCFFLGILICATGVVLSLQIVPRWVFKNLGLAFTFPCAMLALSLPYWTELRGDFWLPFWQGTLNTPLIMLPPIARFLSLPEGTLRTAKGLGAKPLLRLKKLWLPLLFLPLLLSLVLIVFLVIFCRVFTL